MSMTPHTVYGYADHKEVQDEIAKRLNELKSNKDVLYATLQEAIQALLEINSSVPVQSRHRHLVANALERFASGPSRQNTHKESTAA